jgi:hypothetical protein
MSVHSTEPRAASSSPTRAERAALLALLAAVWSCSPGPATTEPASPVAPTPPAASAVASGMAPPATPPPVKARPTPVASGLSLRNHVAMAVDGVHVYWGNDEGRELARAPVGGGPPVALAQAGDWVHSIAASRDMVYWAEDRRIMKVPLGGGAATQLARAQQGVSFLALDATSAYWASSSGAGMTIERALLSGGEASVVVSARGTPGGLALDGTHVYWTSWGADFSVIETAPEQWDGAVLRAPLAGGAPEVLASHQPSPHFLGVSASSVVWNNTGPKSRPGLKRIATSGGSVTELAQGVHAADVAVDDERVYWTDYQAGTVMTVGIQGGEPAVLAEGQARPNAIVLDAHHLYWANLGGGPGESSIMKLPKP